MWQYEILFADLVDNYAVALFRPNVMLTVLDIIVENVPELTALDLSDNKLYSLDNLSVLSLKVPNLRVLHIGRNRVSYPINSDCFTAV
jgi:Leucine-rich repeat (LRR) protein